VDQQQRSERPLPRIERGASPRLRELDTVPPMPELHVVFGTGSLGLAVARELRRRGHRVRMVNRKGRAEQTDPDVETVAGDASDPASARKACAGAKAVYFCAAPPYTDWPALYPAMQAGLIAGAGAAGARLVTAENVYPYGKVDGTMIEGTPLRPCSRKGELRARLNQELLDAHEAGKVSVALGRAPDYYGPGATATTIYGERVFWPALAGKSAQVFGDLGARHTWIYVDDFAHGLVTLGEREEAGGKIWHLPCPPALTQQAMLDLIYKAAGQQKTKAQAMPGWLLELLAVFVPIMRELAEMEYQWRRDYVFEAPAFTKVFGANHITPHAAGVETTLEWFRKHPRP
jgi:nucleoside-diphosphate-sugar epimerase